MAQLRSYPVYFWTEKVLKVLFTGYIPAPKEKEPLFYIGMMNTTISGNTLEGVRLRAGGMTTAWLNPHLFGRGYMAYGFRDHRVKGLAELEYSFHRKKEYANEFPIHSLKLRYLSDVNQYGQHYLYTSQDNVFLALKRQKDDRKVYLRFAMVFLLVNLIGFAGYYIHPAAPPWYAMNYGFDPILDTPGNVAGLGRFDELLGCSIFNSIYGRNANVFAAVPSLHAAYMVVALAYAVMDRSKKWLIALFAVIMVGIWWTAVYSGHHYLIDVMLGISCALLGIFVFEKGLMKWGAFGRFFERYSRYIK